MRARIRFGLRGAWLALGASTLMLSGYAAGQAGAQPQKAPNMAIAPQRPAPRPQQFGAPGSAQRLGGPAAPPRAAEPPAHHGGGEHHEAEEDESAPPGPINWWHGLLGTKEGVEPNLAWRAPGEPAPFLAVLLNFAVMAFILVRYGRKPLAEGLTRRKSKIMQEIEQARQLKEAAERRLRGYQAKIDGIQEEMDRIRRELREQGEHERERIVREANERRERMRKDAELLLSQELKQMQGDVMRETVDAALAAAAELVASRITRDDQDRLAEAFLNQLPGIREGSQSSAYQAVAAGSGQAS